LPDGDITPYPAYGFTDLFLPDGGVTPYPAYGFTDIFLPDGGGFVGRVSAAPPGNHPVGHKA
jgi:hypothetical protein